MRGRSWVRAIIRICSNVLGGREAGVGTLIADPQLRAALDAVIAKLGAPGMCNPDDTTQTVDGEPSEEVAGRDTRTPAQRAHDALTAGYE